jgi:hypothetical protein
MVMDIRTQKGKLVGKFDKRTSLLSIKDGNKITQIIVPTEGLRLIHTVSNGVAEEVYIPGKGYRL